nr:MAG TPA: hypothetical protein [Caudoviricetes sp.]
MIPFYKKVGQTLQDAKDADQTKCPQSICKS